MKRLFNKCVVPINSRFLLAIIVLFLLQSCNKGTEKPVLMMTTVATGLHGPMGLEADRAGNIWVAEPGTANNDGKVVVITPDGKQYDAVVNLSSILNKASGEVQGTSHLLLDKDILYVLSGDYLYSINVSAFKPGHTPIDASTLPFEDIAAFVISYPFVNNYNDSHPYNLVKGPEGDLYIADAGANAIIHRKSAGNYSVLAEVPSIPNPTPMGPPRIESVPTGIIFDGHDFLVATLLGFPFPEGQALVYRISLSGKVSVFQNGFTSLVDIARGNHYGMLALQFSTFGPAGFNPNTGGLILFDGKTMNKLATLNMPVGIKQVNEHCWYISSMGDGTVIKATY